MSTCTVVVCWTAFVPFCSIKFLLTFCFLQDTNVKVWAHALIHTFYYVLLLRFLFLYCCFFPTYCYFLQMCCVSFCVSFWCSFVMVEVVFVVVFLSLNVLFLKSLFSTLFFCFSWSGVLIFSSCVFHLGVTASTLTLFGNIIWFCGLCVSGIQCECCVLPLVLRNML